MTSTLDTLRTSSAYDVLVGPSLGEVRFTHSYIPNVPCLCERVSSAGHKREGNVTDHGLQTIHVIHLL
jgi:hypothetical protein